MRLTNGILQTNFSSRATADDELMEGVLKSGSGTNCRGQLQEQNNMQILLHTFRRQRENHCS